MSLRQKLLVPLLLISLMLGLYLYAFWVPDSLAHAEAAYLATVEKHLDTVAEGLTPLLLGSQLDVIHENLAGLHKKNTDWLSIRLLDDNGRQLYPLLSEQAPSINPGRPVRNVNKAIVCHNTNLGVLIVQVDLAPTRADAMLQYRQLAATLFAMVATVALTLWLTLEIAVRRPLNALSKASRGLAREDFDTQLPKAGTDEVGALVRSFAMMRDDLRAKQLSLLQEISERERAENALKSVNETLEQRVGEEVAKNREKDHLLIHQSRLAAMGEMIHNIAHQWRQPLNALSVIISNLKDDYDYHELNERSLNEAVLKSRRLLQQMSDTIDDFRDFFRPDREASEFDLGEAVMNAVLTMDDALSNSHIELLLERATGLLAYGYPNQFAQVVLNLLANAKETLQAHKPDGGWIRLRLARVGQNGVLSIEDNGGGIPESILSRIFDPYFTTKEQGSGVGLYMAKTVVERNMKGHITAANGAEGAVFTLSIPLVTPRPQA